MSCAIHIVEVDVSFPCRFRMGYLILSNLEVHMSAKTQVFSGMMLVACLLFPCWCIFSCTGTLVLLARELPVGSAARYGLLEALVLSLIHI